MKNFDLVYFKEREDYDSGESLGTVCVDEIVKAEPVEGTDHEVIEVLMLSS